MNELHEKFKDKGLSVIGVTGESKGQTEPWVEKHSMRYAYAYDKGLAGMSKLGMSGFPSAALIDASGTIVWQGHPSSLTDAIVEQHIVGALPTPAFEWPKAAKGVRKAFLKDQLGKALEAAAKMGDEGEDVHAAIQGVIESRTAQVERLFEEGDFLAVEETGEKTAKALDKLPERTRVDAVLEKLKGDDEAQVILKAQLKVRKTVPEKIKKKNRTKVITALKKIAKKHPDTAAARDAERAIANVRSKK
ncbi:MAG: redoxin domain-containing protein [bacterium]|nr:redoxin domain-containing protein [bacterium]